MSSARKPLKFFTKANQTGQGIIEIVVVLALATILILALVALSVRSNRASNFSRAEDQAARLAQEGMERIRNMRDKGSGTVNLPGCAESNWACIFNEDFSGAEPATVCDTPCLDFTQDTANVPVDTRTFARRVIVRDDVIVGNPCNLHADSDPVDGDWDDIKQFTVEVTWTDTTGDHTSTTSSCLRRAN